MINQLLECIANAIGAVLVLLVPIWALCLLGVLMNWAVK